MSYINDFLFEVNQYPRFGKDLDLFTIKDYFFYDSNCKEYGYRDMVIPLKSITNKEQVPDQDTIRSIINNNIPIMRRVIEQNQTESWAFDLSVLEETKDDY